MGELATYMERRCQRLVLLSMVKFHRELVVQSWRNRRAADSSDMQWATQWRKIYGNGLLDTYAVLAYEFTLSGGSKKSLKTWRCGDDNQ